jgi:hypothetical protein
MLTPLWNSSVRIHAVLQRYAPTNIILGTLRRRRYLKWGAVAGVAGVAVYGTALYFTRTAIEAGAPGWLNILVLLLFWNAIKFLWTIPASILRLAIARNGERRMVAQFIKQQRAAAECSRESFIAVGREERREMVAAVRGSAR